MSSLSNFTRHSRNGAIQRELAELDLPPTLLTRKNVGDGAAIWSSDLWALPWLSECCSVVVIHVDVGLRRYARARAMARPWRCRWLSRLLALRAETWHDVLPTTCTVSLTPVSGERCSSNYVWLLMT